MLPFNDNVIGWDFSAGTKIRPLTNENFFLLAGVSVLRPQGGFANAVSGTTTQLYSVFAAFQVAY